MTAATKYLFLTLVFSILAAPVFAQNDDSFSDAQKAEMGNIIKDYLMENPEVIMEAVEVHRNRAREQAEEQAKQMIENNANFFSAATLPHAGAEKPAVKIVEFFDYNCGYCKRALTDVQMVLDENQDIQVLFVEMPILSDTSNLAAQWALAADKQEKYFEYHVALMEQRTPKNEETLTKIAQDLGLDVEKLKKDAESEDVQKQLDANKQMAQLIGISGTPAFFVGKDLYRGYLGEEGMKEAVKKARGAE